MRKLAAKPWYEKSLFDGDSQLFERALKGAGVYFEYGVGLSTVWVARHAAAEVHAVDTSAEWIHNVNSHLGEQRERVRLTHVDVGPLGGYGRPLSYERRDRFKDYVRHPGFDVAVPDVILVDGRFRVASFLESLRLAPPGCAIIFDDYTERPRYHVVAEFVEPTQVSDRQALFHVPDVLDQTALELEVDKFRFVLD